MDVNADTLILASAALVLCVIVGLVVSLWRGLRARRALGHTRSQLEHARAEVTQLQGELGQSANQLAVQESRSALELEALRQRLQDRDTSLNRERNERAQLADEYQLLREDAARLRTQQEEREEKYQEQLSLLKDARDSLKKEFENLANKIFEDKGERFTTTSQATLESILKPFREQITGFQTRINEVHTESVKGNATLESEIKKVLDVGLEMNTQASNLTTALKGDKKTAGNWGEAQLQRTLELAGLQAGEHYEAQASFRDDSGKRKLPDFIIKLPDNKHLVIDSKVSLVDYDRAIAADTDEERTEALNAHANAVRNHINDLASKEYTHLPDIESPDFVLMFMPVEPAYIEAMKHNKALFNFGYEKGVVMVSHTTLMPILRTVANLWMVEQSNREAREISDRAGEIYNQVCLVAERLQKLGNTLRTVNNQYNETVTGLAGKQGLHGKVERFTQLSKKATKSLPSLEPLHEEIDSERLATIGQDAESLPEPTIANNVQPIQGDAAQNKNGEA